MAYENMKILRKNENPAIDNLSEQLDESNEISVIHELDLDGNINRLIDICDETLEATNRRNREDELKRKIENYTGMKPKDLASIKDTHTRNQILKMMPKEDVKGAQHMIARIRKTDSNRLNSKNRRDRQKKESKKLSQKVFQCESLRTILDKVLRTCCNQCHERFCGGDLHDLLTLLAPGGHMVEQ